MGFFIFFLACVCTVCTDKCIAYVNLPSVYLYRNPSVNVRNIDRPTNVNQGGAVIYNVSPKNIAGNFLS